MTPNIDNDHFQFSSASLFPLSSAPAPTFTLLLRVDRNGKEKREDGCLCAILHVELLVLLYVPRCDL